LSEAETEQALAAILADFADRHTNVREAVAAEFSSGEGLLFHQPTALRGRQLYIGALFSGEYALECAALSPSIVAQSGPIRAHDGELRFILSLARRAEGHISSIEFRTGVNSRGPPDRDRRAVAASSPRRSSSQPDLQEAIFWHKLAEMGFETTGSTESWNRSATRLRARSRESMEARVAGKAAVSREVQRTTEVRAWLAESNYEVHFHVGRRLRAHHFSRSPRTRATAWRTRVRALCG